MEPKQSDTNRSHYSFILATGEAVDEGFKNVFKCSNNLKLEGVIDFLLRVELEETDQVRWPREENRLAKWMISLNCRN